MATLEDICKEYLEFVEDYEAPKLGGSRRVVNQEESKRFLRKRLQEEISFTDKIIMVSVASILVIIVVEISVLIFYFSILGTNTTSIVGGAYFPLLYLVNVLRRLWHERARMGLVSVLTDKLQSEQLLELVRIVYWEKSIPKASGRIQKAK